MKLKLQTRSANTQRHESIKFLKDYSHPMIPIFSRENFDKKKYSLILKKCHKAYLISDFYLSKSNFQQYIHKYSFCRNNCPQITKGALTTDEIYFILHLRAKSLVNRFNIQLLAMKPWENDFSI